jgi:DNA repair exonuclease SbcCD ATPase subunit
MTELQFTQLSDHQRKMVATAFLMDNPDQRPETSNRFFGKLEAYDATARKINEAMKQAQKSIQDLRKQLDQIVGSINAVSNLIFEELPADKIQEWCMQFDLDQANKVEEEVKQPGPPDIAGHTARMQQGKIVIPK